MFLEGVWESIQSQHNFKLKNFILKLSYSV